LPPRTGLLGQSGEGPNAKPNSTISAVKGASLNCSLPASPSPTDSQPELGPSASAPVPPTHSLGTARVRCSRWKVRCSPAVPSASAPTCSRAKYAYLEEALIPVRLDVLNIENMPHDVADNLPRANQITHEFTCVIRTGWNHFRHRLSTTSNAQRLACLLNLVDQAKALSLKFGNGDFIDRLGSLR
jgi:hypothetical protein